MALTYTYTPLISEPLPLYSRDPETISILSSAPSYVSEVPTYHSRRASVVSTLLDPLPAGQANTGSLVSPSSFATASDSAGTSSSSTARAPPPYRQVSSLLPPITGQRNSQQPSGLPSTPHWAPGFESRALGSIGEVDMHNYRFSHWSSASSSHNRQVQAVARRRAASLLSALNGPSPSWHAYPSALASSSSFSASTTSLVGGGGGGGGGSGVGAGGSGVGAGAFSSASTSSSSAVAPAPASTSSLTSATIPATSTSSFTSSLAPAPLEDPYLVGERAAARARAARIYRETCLRGEEYARQEDKSWDFLLGQMSTWEESDRSSSVRRATGRGQRRGRLLGRVLGMRR